MHLQWSEADLRFQAEVRAFLTERLTPDLKQAGARMTSVYTEPEVSRAWNAILQERGWSAPAWPVEYGGCDWTTAQHYIFHREKALAGAPPLSPMGIGMVGPVIIGHGSPEQKARHLPGLLSGAVLWCQGYSEPQAGSDLAQLQMAAVADGDDFVCTGSKIWTTHAHKADWMFCLVRTSAEDRPQKGITFLLIDMKTPGVTVQPIISLTGEHIQNQVFFENVRVPQANAVGPIGQGWTVAKYLMEFERAGSPYAPSLQCDLEEIIRVARAEGGPGGRPLMDDADFRARLAALSAEITALDSLELNNMARISSGGAPGAGASMLKILGSELQQKVTEVGMEAVAHYAAPWQPQAARLGGPTPNFRPLNNQGAVGPDAAPMAALRYFNERAASIYAGSNEIQHNILAKAFLGL